MIDRLMNDHTEHLIVNRLASMSRFFSGLRRLKVLRHTKQPFAHAFIGCHGKCRPVHQERHSAPRHCYARSFTRRQNSNPACESVNLIQGYFHTQPGDLENGPLTFRLYFLSHSLQAWADVRHCRIFAVICNIFHKIEQRASVTASSGFYFQKKMDAEVTRVNIGSLLQFNWPDGGACAQNLNIQTLFLRTPARLFNSILVPSRREGQAKACE